MNIVLLPSLLPPLSQNIWSSPVEALDESKLVDEELKAEKQV